MLLNIPIRTITVVVLLLLPMNVLAEGPIVAVFDMDDQDSGLDRTLQIRLTEYLAAQKTLATTILKIGGACQVTSVLYDLKKATTELAASAPRATSWATSSWSPETSPRWPSCWAPVCASPSSTTCT